jgi:transmembrane sensor
MIEEPDSHDSRLGSLDQEAYDWVVRFVAGGAQSADMAALKQWVARSPAHRKAFDRASLLWKATGPAGQELLTDQALVPTPTGQRTAASRMTRRGFVGGALAASVAGIAWMAVRRPPLALWPSVTELASDYRTAPGVQRKLALSDQVAIELNSRTSINVRSTDGAADQIDLISGEAAIALTANATKLLSVRAGRGETTGGADARFNVRCDDQIISVTCVAGHVQVDQGNTALSLPAGQQLRYSSRGLEAPMKADLAVITAWQNGVVIFQSTPIAEVVAEINRYRTGRVILTNAALGRRIFNARVPIENIDRVVGQIAETFGAGLTALPGGIVLLG